MLDPQRDSDVCASRSRRPFFSSRTDATAEDPAAAALEALQEIGDRDWSVMRSDQLFRRYLANVRFSSLQTAARTDPRAQWAVGHAYLNGFGVHGGMGGSAIEARRWFSRAAAQDFARAHFSLGALAVNEDVGEPDFAEAKAHYERAAQRGSGIAQLNLGVMYQNREGVSQDFAAAVSLWQLAANQGSAIAKSNLAVMYYNGRGVSQDFGEAMRLARAAVSEGEQRASYLIGIMYRRGEGVPQSDEEAMRWIRLAAEGGSEVARDEMRDRGMEW